MVSIMSIGRGVGRGLGPARLADHHVDFGEPAEDHVAGLQVVERLGHGGPGTVIGMSMTMPSSSGVMNSRAERRDRLVRDQRDDEQADRSQNPHRADVARGSGRSDRAQERALPGTACRLPSGAKPSKNVTPSSQTSGSGTVQERRENRAVDLDHAPDQRVLQLRSRRPVSRGCRARGPAVIASTATARSANDFVNASGRNILPSIPPSAKTGRNERSMIATEKKMGRPTARQAGRTTVAHVAAHGFVAEPLAQAVHRVLGHDDRRIDQHADRDRDARPATWRWPGCPRCPATEALHDQERRRGPPGAA